MRKFFGIFILANIAYLFLFVFYTSSYYGGADGLRSHNWLRQSYQYFPLISNGAANFFSGIFLGAFGILFLARTIVFAVNLITSKPSSDVASKS